MATKDTKKPTGLSIARDTLKFTLSWKIADNNYTDGQQFQYKTNVNKAWTSVNVGATATSKAVSLTAGNYYPTTNDKLKEVTMRVRGKRTNSTQDNVTTTYNWSEWSEKSFTVNEPKKPTVTQTLNSSNKSTFTWDTETSTKDSRHSVNVEYQAMLLHNCNETNGADLRWSSSQSGWSTGSGNMSASQAYTEDSTTLSGGSYTRWFRCRSRGAAGASDWRYTNHVYARPYQPRIKDVGSTVADNNTTVRVDWASTQDAAHPIDESVVQYAIAVPATGFACPASPGWTDLAVVTDTAGTDSIRSVISDAVDTDECLWVRVVNKHDLPANDTPSDSELVRAGALAAPTNLTVSNISTTNHTATVSATNNSSVPDSQLAVVFRMNHKSTIVGVIAHNASSATVTCPDFDDAAKIGFTVYAFQGSYTTRTKNGVTIYTIDDNMRSASISQNEDIPVAPDVVTASSSKSLTEAIIRWHWTWRSADMAEISWSRNKNAWESTDEPERYVVNDSSVNKWRVSGIEAGFDYYFRVRLGASSSEDEAVWGPYSDVVALGVYTKPTTPVIQLSAAQIEQGGTFTASWEYSSPDGIRQAEAEVIAVPDGTTEANYYQYVVGRTKSAQAVNIKTKGWTQGASRNVMVRVTSKSGLVSDWSDPVAILIPEALTCSVSSSSLSNVTISDDGGTSRTVSSLTALPMSVTVTGAPTGGTATIIIEREDDYRMLRPDDIVLDGYAGEAIVIMRQPSGSFSVRKQDLMGRLDEGAKYTLRAIVSGEKYISAEATLSFEVHWSTRANIPNASTIEYLDRGAVKITPSASTSSGATCDIYRLSADKPELIVEDGSFGTAYVDPFPTLGESGGYRVVYKTANGDYVTSANKPAWTDTPTELEAMTNIINFNGEQIDLQYNMDVAHSWEKTFKQTKYLGGSIQGDWNNTVSRSSSIAAATVVMDDLDKIEAMRRLAAYSGVCHVRTVDGSSYAADVQVNESRTYKSGGQVAEFSLKITRVDNEALDGVPYSAWS